MINCKICSDQFKPKHSLHIVCKKETCKRERKRRYMNEWKWRTGRADPNRKNWWTVENVKYLWDNRYTSTKEIAATLGRSADSVKEKRSRIGAYMLATCIACGSIFKRINQHCQCEECTPDQKGYAKEYNDSLNGRWHMYKSNAKKRNIEFNVSIAEFYKFWKKPCNYCGDEIELVGIDRIDSGRGYDVENMVSCCSRCNEMKMDSTVHDWIDKMRKVIHHTELST